VPRRSLARTPLKGGKENAGLTMTVGKATATPVLAVRAPLQPVTDNVVATTPAAPVTAPAPLLPTAASERRALAPLLIQPQPQPQAPAMATSDLRALVASMRRPAERALESPTLTTGRRRSAAAADRWGHATPPSPYGPLGGDDLSMVPLPHPGVLLDSPVATAATATATVAAAAPTNDENAPSSPSPLLHAGDAVNQRFHEDYARTKASDTGLRRVVCANVRMDGCAWK
jgi:hypothetical protein